jgi:hypothetical protein
MTEKVTPSKFSKRMFGYVFVSGSQIILVKIYLTHHWFGAMMRWRLELAPGKSIPRAAPRSYASS